MANPLIIGPDSESEQWVSAVAKDSWRAILSAGKNTRGDREVEYLSRMTCKSSDGRTPVIVDDIISSGRTMIEAVRLIIAHGATTPVCIAVHGLFADSSDALLAQAGARVVTSNSIPHDTNGIDVGERIAASIRQLAEVRS